MSQPPHDPQNPWNTGSSDSSDSSHNGWTDSQSSSGGEIPWDSNPYGATNPFGNPNPYQTSDQDASRTPTQPENQGQNQYATSAVGEPQGPGGPVPPSGPVPPGGYGGPGGHDPNSWGAGQPGYGPAPQPQPSNSFGITALVLGIVGLLICWIPVLGLLIALAALLFGILGLSRKNAPKTTSIIGTILGLLSLIISGIITILTIAAGASFLSFLDSMVEEANDFASVSASPTDTVAPTDEAAATDEPATAGTEAPGSDLRTYTPVPPPEGYRPDADQITETVTIEIRLSSDVPGSEVSLIGIPDNADINTDNIPSSGEWSSGEFEVGVRDNTNRLASPISATIAVPDPIVEGNLSCEILVDGESVTSDEESYRAFCYVHSVESVE